jgi:hypothetical protein
MTRTAARPWWADVQHLRPDGDGDTDRALRSGRFDRPSAPSRRSSTERPTTTRVSSRAEAPDAHAAARPERRTIEIRGQVDRVHGVAPVPSAGPQRHRGRRASERVGPRPDRVAMWAVLLGLLLILVALLSSPGADAAVLLAGWV